jgi:2'-5' RNA ligase
MRMRTLQGYRYFLGFKMDPQWLPLWQRIGRTLGLPIRLDLLHLTLCVIAETAERDHFIRLRVKRALDGRQMHSFSVDLSEVRAGPRGASARSVGRQCEIQDFYRSLVRLLHASGIEPLHRKSGLHPHVTLSYRACRTELLTIALQWIPVELLLIESEVGLSRHNVLENWRLLPPCQPLLPLEPIQLPGRPG